MFVDRNHILCVSPEEVISSEVSDDIQQRGNKKMYQHVLSGCVLESFDKKVFVWHKKEIKEVFWKDLWNKMSVFWLESSSDNNDKKKYGVLDPQSIVAGLSFFQAYDEERGETYCFLPRYSVDKMEILKQKLSDISIDLDIRSTEKWVVFSAHDELVDPQILGYLFGLSLIYGKRDIKEGDLKSVKIQVPLFGQYLEKEEVLNKKISQLQKEGLFLTKNIQTTKSWLVYEIVVSDYEVLQIWDNLYQRIENIHKISKYEQFLEAKIGLVSYVKENNLANEQELLDLESAKIKLLVKE